MQEQHRSSTAAAILAGEQHAQQQYSSSSTAYQQYLCTTALLEDLSAVVDFTAVATASEDVSPITQSLLFPARQGVPLPEWPHRLEANEHWISHGGNVLVARPRGSTRCQCCTVFV